MHSITAHNATILELLVQTGLSDAQTQTFSPQFSQSIGFSYFIFEGVTLSMPVRQLDTR